jgi:small subunit ribosomal protein S17
MSKEITQKNTTNTTKEVNLTTAHIAPLVRRMQLSGIVASDKMKDTIVVTVERYVKHPKYHKFMKRTLRLKAHDAGNTKKVGDKVTIESCRPMSRDKAFKVIS